MRRMFAQLNEELSHSNTIGELYLVGGAVMCLALKARPSTRDVDGVFHPVTRCERRPHGWPPRLRSTPSG